MAEHDPHRHHPDPVEIPGPWQHRHVAANGARFHVAEAGPSDGPLVLLLHGFPEFWWTWRAQLPVLAGLGHRAVAMDLRGYGGSDKTPNGYDPLTLAQDVAGVVKALGARSAVLVGHGWGGYVAWTAAALHAREVSALCAVSAPHPAAMLGALRPGQPGLAARPGDAAALGPRAAAGRPVQRLPGRPPAHLERSRVVPGRRRDRDVPAGDRALAGLALRAGVPPLAVPLPAARRRPPVRPADAPAGQPAGAVGLGRRGPGPAADAVARSRAHVVGELTERVLPGVGHFPHEEAPEAFTAALTGWLERL